MCWLTGKIYDAQCFTINSPHIKTPYETGAVNSISLMTADNHPPTCFLPLETPNWDLLLGCGSVGVRSHEKFKKKLSRDYTCIVRIFPDMLAFSRFDTGQPLAFVEISIIIFFILSSQHFSIFKIFHQWK